MKPQTESHGITPAELVARMGLPAGSQLKVSGGPIQNFAKGWAHEVLYSDSSVSHYFRRDGFRDVRSLCGMHLPVRFLHGPGNYGRCRNCIRVMSRLIRQGAL